MTSTTPAESRDGTNIAGDCASTSIERPSCGAPISGTVQRCPEGREGPAEKIETIKAPQQQTDTDICPYCLSAIRPGDPTIECSKCGIVHHRDCWFDNGGCTTYGCSVVADRIGDSFPDSRREGAFRSCEPRPDIDPKLLDPKVVLPCAVLVVSPALALLGYLFGIYGAVLAVTMAGTILYIARVFSSPDAGDTGLYVAFVILGVAVVATVLLAVATSQGAGIGR